MSTPINDGGPAFPSDYIPGTATTPGMSLRDWFAGQALAGLLSKGQSTSNAKSWMPEEAYELADAMLAARERKGGAA
jgi:hypothetical protein